jgi:hypothetical protein
MVTSARAYAEQGNEWVAPSTEFVCAVSRYTRPELATPALPGRARHECITSRRPIAAQAGKGRGSRPSPRYPVTGRVRRCHGEPGGLPAPDSPVGRNRHVSTPTSPRGRHVKTILRKNCSGCRGGVPPRRSRPIPGSARPAAGRRPRRAQVGWTAVPKLSRNPISLRKGGGLGRGLVGGAKGEYPISSPPHTFPVDGWRWWSYPSHTL